MITITSVSGNIFQDKELEDLKSREHECLELSRLDLEKTRLRRKTDKGTDVGLNFDAGNVLLHGDILKDNKKIILVEQIPEKVISVRLKNKTLFPVELLVLIGHIIGNRHRPVSIKNNVVSFPINVDSELETFQKLFSEIINDIELSVEEMIFNPHTGANVHDHR